MEEKEINITTNQEFLKNDIFEIVRVFFPNQKVDVDFEQNLSDNQITSTATITAAAIPIITNGSIGVLSPVDTAFTERLPLCVPWSEVELSVPD